MLISSSAGFGSPAVADSDRLVPLEVPSAQVWKGEPTAQLLEVEGQLSALILEHPDTFSGHAYSYDYSYLELYYREDRAADAERLVSSSGVPAAEYRLVARKNSRVDLLAQQKAVIEQLNKQKAPWAHVTPDFAKDGVTVALALTEGDAELQSIRTDLYGEATSIELVPAQPASYSAQSDTLRFTMGSLLMGPNRCSAGFPIVLSSGVRGVVTAGHCGDGVFENPGGASGAYIVGKRYISTWLTSNTSTTNYGDWEILYGNVPAAENPRGLPVIAGDPDKVERFIYMATNPATGAETEKLLIGAMDFGIRAMGGYLCASGSTSGMTCRYRVTAPDTIATFNNGGITRTVGRLTLMMRDDNSDGIAECTTLTRGDSGGSVFYDTGHTPPQAKGYGIVTGGIDDPTCGPAVYGGSYPRYVYTTRMQGIKAYDPTAAIGGFS